MWYTYKYSSVQIFFYTVVLYTVNIYKGLTPVTTVRPGQCRLARHASPAFSPFSVWNGRG